MISSHGSLPLLSPSCPSSPIACCPSGVHRCLRSTVTSQDTGLPLSRPWMIKQHWPGGGSSGGMAIKRFSGSAKVSQSMGEAGNRSPSEGQHQKERKRNSMEAKYAGKRILLCLFILLESVRLLRDNVPPDKGLVSPSLSSSLPPSVWSKETLSRALLRRCISSSPWGDEKLRAAMVERASAFCLLRDSSLPLRCSFWIKMYCRLDACLSFNTPSTRLFTLLKKSN